MSQVEGPQVEAVLAMLGSDQHYDCFRAIKGAGKTAPHAQTDYVFLVLGRWVLVLILGALI